MLRKLAKISRNSALLYIKKVSHAKQSLLESLQFRVGVNENRHRSLSLAHIETRLPAVRRTHPRIKRT